ncbi:MAG: hypothetical protein ACTSPD_09755 [Promethearchaeota archaeon]
MIVSPIVTRGLDTQSNLLITQGYGELLKIYFPGHTLIPVRFPLKKRHFIFDIKGKKYFLTHDFYIIIGRKKLNVTDTMLIKAKKQTLTNQILGISAKVWYNLAKKYNIDGKKEVPFELVEELLGKKQTELAIAKYLDGTKQFEIIKDYNIEGKKESDLVLSCNMEGKKRTDLEKATIIKGERRITNILIALDLFNDDN